MQRDRGRHESGLPAAGVRGERHALHRLSSGGDLVDSQRAAAADRLDPGLFET